MSDITPRDRATVLRQYREARTALRQPGAAFLASALDPARAATDTDADRRRRATILSALPDRTLVVLIHADTGVMHGPRQEANQDGPVCASWYVDGLAAGGHRVSGTTRTV